MTFANGHALVIGIGSYQKMPDLNVPLTVEDAEEVAAVLHDPRFCGYPEQQVALLCETNATAENIETALDTLVANLKPSDTLFLFYSGHGEYGEDGYYLTTHETEMRNGKVVAGSGLHEKTLLEKIRAIEAKRVILVFNACHSGEISPDSLGDRQQLPSQGLPDRTAAALLGTGEGRVIITACRESQKSYFVRNASMTIFAHALTDGLRGGDVVNRKGYISVFDLYDYVFNTVSWEVERRFGQFGLIQEPELTVQKGIGSMAVALHQGKTPEGELGVQDRPSSLSGKVREIEPSESQEALRQILSGSFQADRNLNVAGRDQFNLQRSKGAILNSSGNVTQHFGSVTNISTGSGDYAGRDMYKQTLSSSSRSAISLQDVLTQVRRKIEQAEQQGQSNLAEDLQSVEVDLRAAIRAETANDILRKQTKLNAATQSLQTLSSIYSDLGGLLALLQQVQSS